MRPFPARLFLLMMLVAAILSVSAVAAFAAGSFLSEEAIAITPPDSAQAARLLNLEPPLRIIREEGAVPGRAVSAASVPVGYIASTWEIAHSVGYSGRLIDVLVAVTPDGRIAGGQLSVVQVGAFLQSLLTGFRWETFLIEPVIFILWGFVGLGLLFWGRGVYCGWLCPFGALQELTILKRHAERTFRPMPPRPAQPESSV